MCSLAERKPCADGALCYCASLALQNLVCGRCSSQAHELLTTALHWELSILTFDVIEQDMLEEDDWVVRSDCRFE